MKVVEVKFVRVKVVKGVIVIVEMVNLKMKLASVHVTIKKTELNEYMSILSKNF